jgi:predicted RNase H-like nuclease
VWSDADRQGIESELYEDLSDVFADHREADRLLADIPIGLESSTSRECDLLARRRLGIRGVSVFPAPCRRVVDYRQRDGDEVTYNRANEIQRENLDSGISQQAWNITDKIAAMDTYLRGESSADESPAVDVYESHPECCFAALNDGYPIAHSKSSQTGRAARFAVLDEAVSGWQSCYEAACEDYYFNQVARDDIIDAIVLCAAGRQPLESMPEEPPEDNGLPMQIVVPKTEPAWVQYLLLAEQ